MRVLIAIAASGFLLSACGGGEVPTAETEPPLGYVQTAYEHRYAPAQTPSQIVAYNFPGAEHVTIGGDLEPRDNLRHVGTENGIQYYIGAVRDGVGVGRLANYGTDLGAHNLKPFAVQPTIYWDPDLLLPENSGIASALRGSLRILNDALPPEFQIVDGGTWDTAIIYPGQIGISLETAEGIGSICGTGVVACAQSRRETLFTSSSWLYIPDDFDTSEYTYPRKVIVHELLHALGISGHVDSVEFPDSIMGTSGEYIPNLGHIISKIDREVLQIIYMSQRTGTYNDWDEWSDVSHHLVGRTEDQALNFGVALFNGLPQPWVRGGLPGTTLAENTGLSGTATWTGSLLAHSGPSPLAGDAELEVGLATLADPDNEQDLRFRDIYFVNRFESTASDRWFPARNIDYAVRVSGNGFWNIDGEGHVTGAFLGAGHEHMGGTFKRTDMIGAFGGSR